jgi:hypothetical protein
VDIASASRFGSIGFATYAAIPAARHRVSSPRMANAVIATIGTCGPRITGTNRCRLSGA